MPKVTQRPTANFWDLNNDFNVVTFDGNHEPLGNALDYAEGNQFTIRNIVSPPARSGDPGFQKVEQHPRSYNIKSDGILITQGSAVGMYSRDCPIAVLVDTVRREGVMLHCGRPAVTPTQFLMQRKYTIVSAGLQTLKEHGSEVGNITAYITAGICPNCFTHNLETDKGILGPILAHYPGYIDPETGGLDLQNLIYTLLIEGGVAEHKITDDGLCTKEHPGLASKRGGDKNSNLVVAYIP